MFQNMVHRNLEKNRRKKVIGALKHIDRIRGARQNDNTGLGNLTRGS